MSSRIHSLSLGCLQRPIKNARLRDPREINAHVRINYNISAAYMSHACPAKYCEQNIFFYFLFLFIRNNKLESKI